MKNPLIFLFLLAVTWSCQDKLVDETSGYSHISLEKAKEHYQELVSQGSLESERFGSFQNMNLLWSRASQGTKDGTEYVEVPAMPEKVKVRLYKFSQGDPKFKSDETVLKYTSIRLAFYLDSDGKIKEKFIVYIPDYEYVMRRKHEVVLNRIGKMQSDFKGCVEYSDRTGNALSVERFEMGKVVQMYNPSTKSYTRSTSLVESASSNARTASCDPICDDNWEWRCDGELVDGEMEWSNCDWQVTGQTCHDDPNCDNDGGYDPTYPLFIADGSKLWKVERVTGGRLQLIASQDNPVAMTWNSSHIYEVINDNLYKVNPTTGVSTNIGPGWGDTEAMVGLRGTNYIFAVKDGSLYRIDTSTGNASYFSLDPHEWSGTEAMAAWGDFLYIVRNGTLYSMAINSNNPFLPIGYFDEFGEDPHTWGGIEAMTAAGNYLYGVTAGTMWRVTTSAAAGFDYGHVEAFGDDSNTWGGTSAMVAYGTGAVYAVTANALWKLDTTTGHVYPLGNSTWANTTAMTSGWD